MKKTLTKILFISLLFSAIMPTGAQANGFSKDGVVAFAAACVTIAAVTIVGSWGWDLVSEIRAHNKVENNLRQAIKNNNVAKVNRILKENPLITLTKDSLLGGTSVFLMPYPFRSLETLPMLAVRSGHTEIVKLFINNINQHSINHRNEYWEALIVAVKNDHTEIVKLLLEHGANVGQTPLIIAAKNNNTEIAKLLLEYGADANIREDNNGRTVLMIAAQRSKDAIQMGNIALKNELDNLIKLLLIFGANPLIKDNKGKTVLDQTNNEIIRKFMNQQILPILNGEEVTPFTENPA